MLACPGCGGRLSKTGTSGGPVLGCGRCSGMAVSFSVLNRTADPSVLRRLWYGSTKNRPGSIARHCPYCDAAMTCVNIPAGMGSIDLDVCNRCQIVWFDPTEYSRFTSLSEQEVTKPPALESEPPHTHPSENPELTPTVSDALGFDDKAGPPTPQGWQWAPALLGLPVSLDAPPVMKKPIVTWGLSILLVVLYAIWAIDGTLEANINYWGFIPAEWARQNGITLLTCFFLHAGLLHVLSNVYFFLIFGDNVEDAMGRLKFIFLIFVSHLAGLGLHTMVGVEPTMPCVGASAGISGVLSYYAVSYPNARIGMFLRLSFIPVYWLRIRVWTALVLYVGLQLLGMVLTYYGQGGQIAYSAHLGGLAVGFVAGYTARLFKDEKF